MSNFYCHRPFEFKFDENFFDRDPVMISFAEKAIMLCKSSFFGDDASYEAILAAKTPAEVKRLGRTVLDFDEDLWAEFREHFAYNILLQKFASDERMRRTLLSTRSAVLCEASRNDAIWGIGLSVDDPDALYPERWRGQNILGNVLMRVRQHFQQ